MGVALWNLAGPGCGPQDEEVAVPWPTTSEYELVKLEAPFSGRTSTITNNFALVIVSVNSLLMLLTYNSLVTNQRRLIQGEVLLGF